MKKVIFVGMDLFPPYNEICSKLVHTLVMNLSNKRNFLVLSFPNPGIQKNKPPNENYIMIQPSNRLFHAILLPFYLIKYSQKNNSIIHFMMPAKHSLYVSTLLWLCRLRKVPTVFTLLKNSKPQIRCAGIADIVVAQTKPALKNLKNFLPTHIRRELIQCASIVEHINGVPRNPNEILFIGIPWKKSQMAERGVQLLFDTIRYSQTNGYRYRYTILNRALPNKDLIDNFSKGLSKDTINLYHKSSKNIAHYYSKASVFLCLHLSNNCPDPPLSVIEACACGCPIITTKYNSIAEDIRREGAGIIVEPTPQSIMTGIDKIVSNFSMYSQNAKALANRDFNENLFYSSYESIYRSLDYN